MMTRTTSTTRLLASACLFLVLLGVTCGWRCHHVDAFTPIANHRSMALQRHSIISVFPLGKVPHQWSMTLCQENSNGLNGGEGAIPASSSSSSYRDVKDVDDEDIDSQSLASILLLITPAIMALAAFSTYRETATAFRSVVDIASGHTWAPVDGGAYLTDLITPALRGPVSSFISLLFGTLTSMTVGNVYVRQANMAHLLGDTLEDLRLLDLHIEQLPTAKYREQAQRLINAYGALVVENIKDGLDNYKVKERREAGRRILEQHMELLHDVSGDKSVETDINGRALDESYSTLNRLFQTRSNLITTYENSFPVWHYGNLTILAFAILFIFLVLTDKTALLFLGGFQLRMCWAMLIGTFSMLAVVIYDLNTPLSGAFQIVKPMNLKLNGLQVHEFVNRMVEEDPQDMLS